MTIDKAKQARDILRWIDEIKADDDAIRKAYNLAKNGDLDAIDKLAKFAMTLNEFKLKAHEDMIDRL